MPAASPVIDLQPIASAAQAMARLIDDAIVSLADSVVRNHPERRAFEAELSALMLESTPKLLARITALETKINRAGR
jgi:hypothetical protein